MELKEMEAALEAVLFAAGEPVGVERLCLGLETDRPTLDAVAQRLMDQYSYERRGIRLLRLDASYQLCSAPEYAGYVRKTLESRKPARLSQPALEVLAIIAYYQPVTRAYVDQVRGVDSSYTVGLLLDNEGQSWNGIGLTPDIGAALTTDEQSSYYDFTVQTDPQITRAVSAVNALIG